MTPSKVGKTKNLIFYSISELLFSSQSCHRWVTRKLMLLTLQPTQHLLCVRSPVGSDVNALSRSLRVRQDTQEILVSSSPILDQCLTRTSGQIWHRLCYYDLPTTCKTFAGLFPAYLKPLCMVSCAVSSGIHLYTMPSTGRDLFLPRCCAYICYAHLNASFNWINVGQFLPCRELHDALRTHTHTTLPRF